MNNPKEKGRSNGGKRLRDNIVPVLLAALLTVSITIVSLSVRGNAETKELVVKCEKEITLNTRAIEANCRDIQKSEDTMIRQLQTLNSNFDQRLTSVERTLALVFQAVTDKTLQQEGE